MAKSPSKRFGILLTTSLFIILAMGLYYIYTQNVKENKVKRRAFKVLYRQASDLAEKEKDIRAQYIEPLIIELTGINNAIKEKKDRIDSIQDILIVPTPPLTYNPDLQELSEHLRSKNSEKLANEQLSIQINELNKLEKKKEELHAAFRTSLDAKSTEEDWYLLRGISYNVAHEDPSDSIFIRKEQLFGDVFGAELFKSYAVFRNDTIIYKTAADLSDLKLVQIQKKNEGGNSSNPGSDKSFLLPKTKDKAGYSLINPSENQLLIKIGGQDYQAFIIPVQSVGMTHLVGLMSNNKYLSMKRGFDRGLISAITIFIVLLLLGIPVVKLMVVTPGEAFTIKSMITLLLSGAGLFFMVFFFSLYVSNKTYIKNHIIGHGEHLEQLSGDIELAFNNEIDSMLLQLDVLADVVTDPTVVADLTIPAGSTLLSLGKGFNSLNIQLQRKIKKKAMAKMDSGTYINWLEAFTASLKDTMETVFVLENGKEYKQSPTGINISKRDYVQNTDRFNKNGKYFGFESIFSLNTAKPQVVISKKQPNSDYAICVTAEMHSLNNVVLPYGYSFCIIDKNGKEWFHQNPRNNLRENLFEETDHFPLLKAAVKSRRSNTLSCDYKMKRNLMRIAPLDSDMGLFLVTMCDVNDYYQIFHQSAYMILGSALLIFLFWLVVSFLYRWYNKMNNPSRYQAHSLLYFFPHKEFINKYTRLIILNSAFLILFVLATLMLYDLVYVNHWVRLIGLAGAGLFLWNVKEMQASDSNFTFAHLSITFLSQIALLFSIEYLLGGSFKSWSIVLAIGLLLLINLVLFYILKSKWLKQWNPKWSFKVYFAYIFSFAMAAIFVPLFTIYTVVFNQEITLHFMHQQRYVADKLIERQNRFEKENKQLVVDELNKRGKYYNHIHGLRTTDTRHNGSGKLRILSTENYVQLFGDVRSVLYFINNKIEDRGNLVKPNYISSADSLYVYSIANDKLKLRVKPGGYPYFSSDSALEMDAVSAWDLIKRFRGFVVGWILVIILYISFFPKIALYLFPQYKYRRDRLAGNKSIARPVKGAKRYLVAMPDEQLFESVLKTDRAKMFALHDRHQRGEFIKFDATGKDLYLFWQHGMFKKVEELKEFLLRMKQLLSKKLYRSISIVCFDNPVVSVAELQGWMEKINDNKPEIAALRHQLTNLLAGFSLTYIPLLDQLDESSASQHVFKGKLAWLNREVRKNAFLLSCYHDLKEKEDSFEDNKTDGVINDYNVYVTHLVFLSYYQKIWNSCSNNEKSVLYDISEDHVINMHKEGVVSELINKGLVCNGRYLSLFNLSFTHFVAHQQMEVKRINAILCASHASGWSQYSLPIKLLAVAILIFLFVTQQEFLSGLQSIIVSVGAIVTFGARFFNNPFKSEASPAK
ncbi:Peptidoglycan/LPS O-acetylase OafA/YrhL, contains acyltransferase and SGNH-hydrolase domains [Saccharicrinis carchari]|uniref:Peptidoglycan/LPS O-acetylase OafA/YrhL, contains acyltransferase and SGNH-hydrolase domains n=1 Tax=Saccharicrinis carchari TaxID=1168039 RepID=A0A521ANV7_SACCC|nr:hypothetical protein [Saccharicrinis carchari]SMO36497.1 Peptidoglycan/LPS O-acetylase OafA/YrhL, contains acyltransferase and SGNH-hydrolase domains [Saccharicrinis carchari]